MTTVRRWNELAGMFLMACSGLLFEITATKIFEYSVWANYAYLVISTCMFGMGFAGVLMTRFPRLLRLPAERFLPALGFAMGGGILVGFLTMNSVPIHLPDAPQGWAREMANVGLVFLGLSIPFFFFGLTISYLFENRGKRANVYYFADLLGAGLGAFLLVPLISRIEPQGIVWLCMGMSLAAGAVLLAGGGDRAPSAGRKGIAAALLVAVAALTAWGAPRAKDWIALKVHIEKRTYLADVRAGRIEKSGWSALGRVDIARDQRNENIKRVWIAGGVNWSAIAKFDGDYEKARARRPELIERHSRILLYHLLPHLSKTNHTVCVIGTSGGEDALLALMYGARKVVGVEMDPEIVRFVTEDYRDYAGGLFTDNDYSEIVVDEGRSYLRRSGRKFDVIQQVNNFTPIALQNGAMNLSETYLLTVESFKEFYDHLTDDGILAISRYGAARNLSIAVEMFRRMGMAPADYSKHLIVVQGPRPEIPTMMMKRSPFTPGEVDAVFTMYEASQQNKKVLYAPYRTQDLPELDNNIYYMLATSDTPHKYWRVGCFDYSPVTDNRPFFNRMMRLGKKDRNRNEMAFAPEESILVEPRSRIGRRVPKGDIPPLLILLESMLLATLFLGIPLLSKGELRQAVRKDVKALGYFACLGVAFIFIEICLMQRLILFLGSPVYSISTVLGSLLISAGLGSLASGRFAPTQRNVRRLLWVVAATVLAIHLLVPAITSAALGLSFTGRLLVSIALCCAAGFMMGMPMPSGIRLLSAQGRHIISWGWAINSFFTVVGSALSVILASIYGFGTIFYIATALYALAPWFLHRPEQGQA